MTISQVAYDENSNENRDLVIFERNVGSYNWGIYSKWHLERLDRTGKSVPNIGKYVCGLLCNAYQTDICDLDELMRIEAIVKEEYRDIGEWFETRMKQELVG